MTRRTTRGLALSLLLMPLPPSILGQTQSYRDVEGLRHVADRFGGDASYIPVTGSAPARNLAARFAKQYGDVSDPDLAVVLIRTALSEGAGFFCTADGYILTVRHVVRPVGPDARRAGQVAVDHAQEGLADAGGGLPQGQANPADGADPGVPAQAGREVSRAPALGQLAQDAHPGAHAERFAQGVKGASATPATSVEVVLADQTRARARVVAVSQGTDLALLKLDGYRTPFLALGPEVHLVTGQSVFAYGYPDDDSQGATPGLVVKVSPQELVTTVQLIPGHSGGPLLDASARVVGVNALKRVLGDQGVHAQGRGIAIPIAVALREFPQIRAGVAGRQGGDPPR